MNASRDQADLVIVNKARRELLLLRDGIVLRHYRIALGKAPIGAKEQEGDNRTPEGDYTISGRNPSSRYHLSLRISYPSDADRQRASQRGVAPGGDIMIHGLPNHREVVAGTDWTAGCIAVSNEQMDELWQMVPNGTPIRINP